MNTKKIRLTKSAILRGIPRQIYSCPIALRCAARSNELDCEVRVDNSNIVLGVFLLSREVYLMPRKAQALVGRFDQRKKRGKDVMKPGMSFVAKMV